MRTFLLSIILSILVLCTDAMATQFGAVGSRKGVDLAEVVKDVERAASR